jgi:hypothetical protein
MSNTVKQAKKELDVFVDNNPNLFGVVVATATSTAMEVGAGVVDTLRFGQGLAEGGVGGVVKDTLRLIGLAGPLGRGAKIVQTSINARLARMIVDTGGGICGWVSGAQALRQTGTRGFVTMEDLAKALGKRLETLGGSTLQERVQEFRKLGARIPLIKTGSFDEVVKMTKNNGNVTMISVYGYRNSEKVGHAVYAFRDNFGRLRIMDRGGWKGQRGEVFDSLKQLSKKYGIEGEGFGVREMAVMENVFAKYMLSLGNLPVFTMDVYVLAGVNHYEHETVAQAFEIHKIIMRQGKKALEQGNPRYHVVTSSNDLLPKIAQTLYGDMRKWPVIYEANRDVIGNDVNIIKAGQRLLIPSLPKVRGIKG